MLQASGIIDCNVNGAGADFFREFNLTRAVIVISLLASIWLGFQVKEHDHIYPNLNLQRTEPYIFRPGNRYEGGILDVSGGGKISAWSINRALPHKSLRMQTLVFHEGKQVYASSRKRSFILDRELSADDRAELPTLGVHGYRHTLPRQLRDGLRGEAVLIEIRIFGDRSTDYLAIRREHRL